MAKEKIACIAGTPVDTHFPYFYNELKELSELPIIDITEKMIELLR